MIRLLIAVIIVLLIQYYFIKKIKFIHKNLFPKIPDKARIIMLSIYLFILNFILVSGVFIAVFREITNYSIRYPQTPLNDFLIIYFFWAVLLAIIQLAVFFVFGDILKLIALLLYRKFKSKIIKIETIILLIITIMIMLYVPVRITYDYFAIDVRTIDFIRKDLPEDLEGFKITFISDIQADKYTDERRLRNYIEAVNSTNPDLVLIAGDIITDSPHYIETAAKFLGNIKTEYGVYSCVGDHDHWAYRHDTKRSIREIMEALSKYGAEMVDNDVRVIEIGNSKIGISIITNTYNETISDEQMIKISDKNYKDFKIFLTHQPLNFLIERAKENGYDLFLAGHTHGGQITFLFPFIRLSPTLIETKYVKGDFYFDDMLAVVSGGLGMSLAPIRYNSTPEVVLITLRGK
jgi:uncharacterized protein